MHKLQLRAVTTHKPVPNTFTHYNFPLMTFAVHTCFKHRSLSLTKFPRGVLRKLFIATSYISIHRPEEEEAAVSFWLLNRCHSHTCYCEWWKSSLNILLYDKHLHSVSSQFIQVLLRSLLHYMVSSIRLLEQDREYFLGFRINVLSNTWKHLNSGTWSEYFQGFTWCSYSTNLLMWCIKRPVWT